MLFNFIFGVCLFWEMGDYSTCYGRNNYSFPFIPRSFYFWPSKQLLFLLKVLPAAVHFRWVSPF